MQVYKESSLCIVRRRNNKTGTYCRSTFINACYLVVQYHVLNLFIHEVCYKYTHYIVYSGTLRGVVTLVCGIIIHYCRYIPLVSSDAVFVLWEVHNILTAALPRVTSLYTHTCTSSPTSNNNKHFKTSTLQNTVR